MRILLVEVISRNEVDLLVRLFCEVELGDKGCLMLHILHEALLLLLLLNIPLYEDVVGLSYVCWHDRSRTRRQVSIIGRDRA